ncbi:hypothetical protein M434DRAFT_159221 [Hypoxylon sp. CO27-5]|nr:hypothetical protein M434DRAFT_159221 [Hypoxylon sp. CO27-5]
MTPASLVSPSGPPSPPPPPLPPPPPAPAPAPGPQQPPSIIRHLSTSDLVGTAKFAGFQLSAKSASLFHQAIRVDKERDRRPGKMPLVAAYKDLDREIRDATLTLLHDSLDWEATLDCFAMLIAALFTLYLPYLAILRNRVEELGIEDEVVGEEREVEVGVEVEVVGKGEVVVEVEAEVEALLARNSELSTALAALRFACKMSTDISCKLNADFEAAPRSPLMLSAPAAGTCYLVIVAFASLRRIFPEERGECEENIAEKFESLRLFSFRWGLAG